MKFHNPMIIRQVTLPRGVSFTLNPVMGTKEDPGIENLQTDLLVLTQMSCSHMSRGMSKIDAKLSGELSKTLAESKFEGKAGQTVLLDCRPIDGSQKHILVVGLGPAKNFNGKSVCALMRRTLEIANQLGVEKITMPIFPNRQTGSNLNLAGTVSTLVCRVQMFMDDLPKLKEIELFCTPQARPYLQNGLNGHTPRCMICLNPELGKR